MMSATGLPATRAPRSAVKVAAALAVAPSAALAIASLWWTLSAPLGGGLWRPVPQTLAEAAAVGDTGEVVWQVQTGADPNARFAVRSGLLSDDALRLTPLEAAVWARDADMVELLINRGAVVDRSAAVALRCINLQRGGGSRIDALLPPGESASPAACDTALPAR